MGDSVKPDFSGWATKNDLRCTDGRTIRAGAFEHQDKVKVPLVWQHQHKTPENILGHVILENRAFGVYTHGYFNHTESGRHMRQAVLDGDIESLSIYANNLTEKATRNGRDVLHGDIKEVSLVMAGANPGAFIDKIHIRHGDDSSELDEAIIYTGLSLEHVNDSEEENQMPDEQVEELVENQDSEMTLQEILDSMTEEQRNALYYIVGQVAEGVQGEDLDEDPDAAAEHGTILDGEEFLVHVDNSIQKGIVEMTRNLFESNADAAKAPSLTHGQFAELMADAKKLGNFRDAVLAHADEYGITDIEALFPEARTIGAPEVYSRRMDWVASVLSSTKKTPFAKVKSIVFDITEPEARARGYIKGNQKKDEVIKLMKRTTGSTTIYKKQKLDRDDIIDIDITDINVVAWLKAEIRAMLEEELARAILFGDGRTALDDDKVKDPEGANSGDGIRSIVHDADFYSVKVDLAANVAPKDAVKGLIRARSKYRGTGKPTLYVSDSFLTDIMLEEDKFGRALYETEQALADKLRVAKIEVVDIIDDSENLFAVMVNLADYSIGTNKGGELTSFEDFDIDFNQHKYLMETRLSGALTKPFSAIVVRRTQGTEATVIAPSFDGATDTITIPTSTGVIYTINDEAVTGDVVIEGPTEVVAVADDGYYIAPGVTRTWTYSL